MSYYSWEKCETNVKNSIVTIQNGINSILDDKIIGHYLHGSIAMGCFNPKRSDMDVLVVTNDSLTLQDKHELARFLLRESNSPYPIEISILHSDSLKQWHHPCPYEFHYSEFWRERYEEDLKNNTTIFLNDEIWDDPDLAAHITILKQRGVRLEGESIEDVFPVVPKSDYVDAIMGDFKDCLTDIEEKPVYCCLNLLRVYWYLEEGVISSKLEAGKWGLVSLPGRLKETIRKAVNGYIEEQSSTFTKAELQHVRDYIKEQVDKVL